MSGILNIFYLSIVERRTSNSNTSNANQQFNDSQQLFLGNIPHHASEEELKALFSRFGTVVDLRILSKQGQKIQGQRPPPNYGFITYEDAAAVQECLANLVSHHLIFSNFYLFINLFYISKYSHCISLTIHQMVKN